MNHELSRPTASSLTFISNSVTHDTTLVFSQPKHLNIQNTPYRSQNLTANRLPFPPSYKQNPSSFHKEKKTSHIRPHSNRSTTCTYTGALSPQLNWRFKPPQLVQAVAQSHHHRPTRLLFLVPSPESSSGFHLLHSPVWFLFLCCG